MRRRFGWLGEVLLILSFYETGVGDESLLTYHALEFIPQMNFPRYAKIV